MDDLEFIKKNAGLTEERDYDLSPGVLMKLNATKYFEVISDLLHLVKRLEKGGNTASAASIKNIIGAMQKAAISFDNAASDLGK